MPPQFVDDITARVRDSRFGQQVLGPRIAQPLAGWLQENFGASPGAEVPAAQIEEGETEQAPAGDVVSSVDPAPSAGTERIAPEKTPATAESPAPAATGFVAQLKAVPGRIKEHNLVVVAAGIAFWGLLAIPATLFAVVSIAGLVLDPDTVRDEVDANLSGLPEEAREIIGDQLASVSGGSTGGLIVGVVFGLLLALWTASGAMAKLMAALNTIYGTDETRTFVKLRGLALFLTFGGIVFISGALFLLAVLPALLSSIDAIGDSVSTLFVWLRFPVLGLVMVVALGLLYHLGPDRRARYRPFTAGAVVATVLWVVLSGLFSVYTATVGSYNETYGSIGGIVILLLWLFITAFVVLIGAELHAEHEAHAHRRDQTSRQAEISTRA